MNGQWLGKYDGTNQGTLVIDLDDRGKHFEGYVYAYDDNKSLPSTFANIRTPDKSPISELNLTISPIDPNTGTTTTSEEISKVMPGVTHGISAKVNLECDGKTLKVKWKTDINTHGEAELSKSRAADASEYAPMPEITTWKQFKEFAVSQQHRRHIFRGQSVLNRLRTSFHRTGRADILSFLNVDRITLHRHLSHRTKHIFNLDIPDQNGAFLNLVQHHGYPTPILDWTFSPFVAAFFAYRNAPKHDELNRKVRIFMFDQKDWCSKVKPQKKSLSGHPHFSMIEFIAIENERMVPQQSISTVTNIDDIESYISGFEKKLSTKFLQVIDLPIKERSQVMDELALMGITAGSLFPGLDGACEELKERFFREVID